MISNIFRVKRQKFGVGSLVCLLVFGAIFTVVGVTAYENMQIDESWARVTGEVVDVSSSISDGSTVHTPVIQYVVDGRTFKVTGGISSSSYPRIGDKREVAYNPARPAQAKVVEGLGAKSFLLLFPAVGISVLALALTLFIRSLRRTANINKLTQTGQKLKGILTDVQSDSSNDKGYKIVVSATDNAGNVQNYISDSLSGIGGLAMADYHKNPIPIDVYVDPSNPQNYYVDVSDIPNLTPQRINELIKQAASNEQSQTFAHTEQPPKPSA